MPTYFGTTINESPTITLVAGTDIENAQGRAVKISGGEAIAATAGVNAVGIIPLSEDEVIKKGSDVTIQVKDIGAWKAGGKIEVGDELTSDADGFAVKATNGNFITAVAVTSAEEKGTIIRVQVVKAGYKPAIS